MCIATHSLCTFKCGHTLMSTEWVECQRVASGQPRCDGYPNIKKIFNLRDDCQYCTEAYNLPNTTQADLIEVTLKVQRHNNGSVAHMLLWGLSPLNPVQPFPAARDDPGMVPNPADPE